MSLIGRLLGAPPPSAAGGRAFVSEDIPRVGATTYLIRVVMPGGAPDNACRRIGPRFDSPVVAQQYADWCNGDAATFSYPVGRA